MVRLLLALTVLASLILSTAPGCNCSEEARTPYVETLDATETAGILVTLNGNLRSLGKYSSVEVYFRWRRPSDSDYRETSKQTMTSIGQFSAQVFPEITATTWEFYAVVTAKNYTGEGETRTFYKP